LIDAQATMESSMLSMTTFTPIEGVVGGALIGIATVAWLWLWLYGRVTGISGIVHGAVLGNEPGERGWRLFYLAGLVVGMLVYRLLATHGLPGTHFTVDLQVNWWVMIVAGFLVGLGTRKSTARSSRARQFSASAGAWAACAPARRWPRWEAHSGRWSALCWR
jgi:hypothetical protein